MKEQADFFDKLLSQYTIGQIASQFTRVPLDDQPPSHLYHYTTVEGFHGIVTSKKVHATHARYLNDRSEQDYAQDVIRRVLKKLRVQTAGPFSKMAIETAGESFENVLPWNAYTFCLCEGGDHLSIWREYAAKGAGYSLGFNTRKLRRVLAPRRLMLLRVLYDPKVQSSTIQMAVKNSIRVFRQMDYRKSETPKSVGEAVATLLNLYALALKDPTFSDEREWRIVRPYNRLHVPGAKFRPARSYLAPYVELDLTNKSGTLPIERVVQGPAMDHNPASESAVWFLHSMGYSKLRFETSIAPLQSNSPKWSIKLP